MLRVVGLLISAAAFFRARALTSPYTHVDGGTGFMRVCTMRAGRG